MSGAEILRTVGKATLGASRPERPRWD